MICICQYLIVDYLLAAFHWCSSPQYLLDTVLRKETHWLGSLHFLQKHRETVRKLQYTVVLKAHWKKSNS